jgi:hypothetical protein
MNTLMDANREWANRPDDQRFASLQDMYLHTFLAAEAARTMELGQSRLSVGVVGDGKLQLNTPGGPMSFTHWSFGQLAQKIGAPASYLRTLPAQLAADNLNSGLSRASMGDDAQLYFNDNAALDGTRKLMALTSTKYGRIMNHQVVKAIIDLPGKWISPASMPKGAEDSRPAEAADLPYATNLQVGDPISKKRALYGSDQNMFAFLVAADDRRIEDGTEGGLSRGFIVRNSEVGDATFEIIKFLYRYVCMNNIIWGTEQVQRISIKHIGRGAKVRAFDRLGVELKAYAEESAAEDIARINAAKAKILGKNLEEVQKLVFGDLRLTTKRNVGDAYELATVHEKEDGNPNTAWGLAQGLTRLSQSEPYADARTELDRAAGSILALAA